MLFAELAVLVHFDPVRVILFVLLCVVIALFALRAGECDLNSHIGTSCYAYEKLLVYGE
jgi:hypothetical protein